VSAIPDRSRILGLGFVFHPATPKMRWTARVTSSLRPAP
jgi:hypothetical protein